MPLKNFLKKISPSFLLDWYHFGWAALAAGWYGFPSRQMYVIGVTGTNGKSTVTHLIAAILEEAGLPMAALSSVQFKIKDRSWPNTLKMTMPGRFQLQKFLRQALEAGCQYAVLEVTSEGIKQYRHRFIDFDAVIFTNLAPEHLEAHGSWAAYRETKARLFRGLAAGSSKTLALSKAPSKKVAIVNGDDNEADYFLQFKADEKYAYGFELEKVLSAPVKKIKADHEQLKFDGSRFIAAETEFNLALLGEFNVYNALAAICFGISQGIDLAIIKKALEKVLGVPGRMEVAIKSPFIVVVDYAHTPDALEKVYQTLDALRPVSGKMIAVLGAAGGGRDKWKRPALGKIAVRYAGQIILTNEDPYDEDPGKILSEIEAGIWEQNRNFKNYEKILDRRAAIRRALTLAASGDIVVITGKGCEPWLCVAGGKKISWDDRQVVREEMAKIKSI